jgi:hypothetical protein
VVVVRQFDPTKMWDFAVLLDDIVNVTLKVQQAVSALVSRLPRSWSLEIFELTDFMLVFAFPVCSTLATLC